MPRDLLNFPHNSHASSTIAIPALCPLIHRSDYPQGSSSALMASRYCRLAIAVGESEVLRTNGSALMASGCRPLEKVFDEMVRCRLLCL